MRRKTLRQTTVLKGIGLHTGMPCSMILKPSEQGYISFIRADIAGSGTIKAELNSVSSVMRGTNLSNAKAEVHTVEHILSALNAFGITDLIIEMDGPEPPVMDGSALEYANAIIKAGFKQIDDDYPILKVTKNIDYKEGDIVYKAEPSDKTKLTFIFLRDHPLVSRQEYTFEVKPDNFLKEIAPARTFGFEEEIEFLRKNGLAKGGTVNNCVVITKTGFTTRPRFENEMARHKILDMLGDFKLINKALTNIHITCSCGGHKSNIEFGKILLKETING
ncbi:MAG: UDP-3-O-acyl-N-acetylglucosamine deacetylase [Elusimicrobiota bacterium]|jgi:UDP-3-O-[3-hydroxymyristoyl] N-acetylglucosamine deacetylase|nr:UDP-3-O-acyl-N-acetylglucosamine deacetylase [Elusimicrobiota bacterium]